MRFYFLSINMFFIFGSRRVLLELALVNWTMRRLIEKGWTPIITPGIHLTYNMIISLSLSPFLHAYNYCRYCAAYNIRGNWISAAR